MAGKTDGKMTMVDLFIIGRAREGSESQASKSEVTGLLLLSLAKTNLKSLIPFKLVLEE